MIVELPSTDLADASATAEWYVPADWTPPAMLTAELPAIRRPRYPNIALLLLFACVAGCIVVVSFALTVRLAQREMPKQVVTVTVTASAKPTLQSKPPHPIATVTTQPDTNIPTFRVDDLPRSKRKR